MRWKWGNLLASFALGGVAALVLLTVFPSRGQVLMLAFAALGVVAILLPIVKKS
jgi:hypothetical protein